MYTQGTHHDCRLDGRVPSVVIHQGGTASDKAVDAVDDELLLGRGKDAHAAQHARIQPQQGVARDVLDAKEALVL